MATEFDGQHEGEEVIFTFRRHPIAMRKGFYLMIIPFLAASIPVLVRPGDLNMLFIAFGGLGVGFVLFLYQWMGWYFSVFIVTNQRIRQVTQKGLFNRSVIDLGISKIQNISYNVPGLSGTMFGFGTMVIQTYVGDLYLDKLHHPNKIYNALSEVIQQYGPKQQVQIDEEVTTEDVQ